MTETLILAAIQAVVDLLEGLQGAPSQAEVDAAVRAALIKASDTDMAAEYAGQKP